VRHPNVKVELGPPEGFEARGAHAVVEVVRGWRLLVVAVAVVDARETAGRRIAHPRYCQSAG
jgi:hypothetical protein